VTADWGMPDPAAAIETSGVGLRQALRDGSPVLQIRIKGFVAIRVASLARRVQAVGGNPEETAS